MFLEILSLIYGILINIVDTIHDSNILLDYKPITDSILIGMTLFFFLYDRIISIFGSGLFTIGGIVGLILIPRSVNAKIWLSLIYLSIPIFIYHLFNINHLLENLQIEDILQFIFTVIPIIVIALLLALVEDILIPEEYSTRKIYDKTFQVIVMLSFLYFVNFSSYFSDLTSKNRLVLNVFASVWLGYAIACTISLIAFPNIFQKK
jgi:hypothetical protein